MICCSYIVDALQLCYEGGPLILRDWIFSTLTLLIMTLSALEKGYIESSCTDLIIRDLGVGGLRGLDNTSVHDIPKQGSIKSDIRGMYETALRQRAERDKKYKDHDVESKRPIICILEVGCCNIRDTANPLYCLLEKSIFMWAWTHITFIIDNVWGNAWKFC